MKNIQKTLLIATLFASYSIAQAQGLIFTEVDTDKNGSVSEQEFNTAKAKRIASRAKQGRQMRGLANAPSFASLDINHDGQLTPDEMRQMHQGRGNRGQGQGMGRPAQPIFENFDINNDGSLTEKEYYDARNKRIAARAKEGRKMRGLANIASFSDIDTNADGKITKEEFGLFQMKHKQQHDKKHQAN